MIDVDDVPGTLHTSHIDFGTIELYGDIKFVLVAVYIRFRSNGY